MGVHLSEQSQADYSDFLKRVQEDPHSVSTQEVAQRYQELVSHAPPELAAEANQHVMGLLPPNEREVLASNINGSPQHLAPLDAILGKDSFLNTPLGKMVLTAAVAYLAQRMLGQSQGQAGTPAPSGGLGDILSSILSGAGGQAPAGSQAPSGGLGDILSSILSGAGGQAPAGSQAPSGGLGDILGGLLGGAASDAQDPSTTEQQPPVRTHRKQ
jgi:hypothetical protein